MAWRSSHGLGSPFPALLAATWLVGVAVKVGRENPVNVDLFPTGSSIIIAALGGNTCVRVSGFSGSNAR